MNNFYKILGIRENATLAEIKRAYREKVKILHPDLSGDITHKDEFDEVVKAYRVLSDQRQRNIFDESFLRRCIVVPKPPMLLIIINGFLPVMMKKVVQS